MFKLNRALAVILIFSMLTGCSAKADLNNTAGSPKSDAAIDLVKDKQQENSVKQPEVQTANKDTVKTDDKKTEDPKINKAKTEDTKQISTPKPVNSAKKIIAVAPKKPVPPPKPAVINTVKKIEIPIPPVQNKSTESQVQTESSGQPVDGNVTNTTANQIIPGLPGFNFEVNNYMEYYKAVYESLKNFEGSVYIKLNNMDANTYSLKVIDDIETDDFDVDYGLKSVKAVLYTMGDINLLNIQFEYSFDRDKLINMRNASDAKAASIITQVISPSMSDIQKEKAVHDYVVSNTAYDYENYLNGTLPREVFNTYGVLINGKAVCEGYSKAMLKLLKMAGLEAKSVVGYGIDEENGVIKKISHAWNMVKINGVYTLLDATWDDPVPDNKTQIYYNYFNVSSEQLAQDHEWNTSKYPKAVAIPLP